MSTLPPLTRVQLPEDDEEAGEEETAVRDSTALVASAAHSDQG